MAVAYQVLRARHNWAERADFALHRPTGTEEFLFLHFKSPVSFSLGNHAPKRLEAGACILLSPKTPHGFSPLEGRLLHDWMHFFPLDEPSFSALQLPQNAVFFPQDTPLITSSLRRIEQELLTQEPHYERAISATADTLFLTLSRQLSAPPIKECQSGHLASFEELRHDLYRNPRLYHNTTKMAQAVQLSRSRFSVLYQKIFHVSPIRDLIRARIERACYYLSSGTQSIPEIAELCGYQNEYHFIRQFKEEVGMTPGAFRNK